MKYIILEIFPIAFHCTITIDSRHLVDVSETCVLSIKFIELKLKFNTAVENSSVNLEFHVATVHRFGG